MNGLPLATGRCDPLRLFVTPDGNFVTPKKVR